MELDTGSALSLMTIADYKKIFGKQPSLQPSEFKLRTYTGEIIHPLGKTPVHITTSTQDKQLELYILPKGSNPIFGRDWRNHIQIDWKGRKFSKIDLRQAYFQLPLKDNCRHLTTINTSKGLYSFNRLVFGITSAPAVWQKTMDQILLGMPGVLCNQDDMVVSGKTEEEHHENLCKVLQRLQDCGLRANFSKMCFLPRSSPVLWHQD
ncbi:transposon Tf2-9 polyprotein [Elysia marginata]|uniref:Transposon Tf2-9 polyprotein n=1 Tax=Elysia marginata TaxID=1093978 RepID=A0AAV4FQ58_9GAST|nr:transposon Tf2-9 polyprotein [Elysia marginata]